MSISKIGFCTRTHHVHLCRQIDKKNTNTRTNQTRRPANPPARLAFRQRTQRSKQQNTKPTKTGPEPKQNTHKIDLPWDAVACPLHHSQKRANELVLRHSGKHEGFSLYVDSGMCYTVQENKLYFTPLSASSQISSSEGLHGQSRHHICQP